MKYLLLLFCLAATNFLFAQKTSLQFKASAMPTLFGGGVVSDGFENRDMAISPANDELFYTIQHARGTFSAILHSKKINGQWTAPEVASFSGRFNDLEPAFSPDGNTLFFTSNRPLKEGDTLAKDYDLWYLKKKGVAWEGPFNMGPIVNGDKDEFYASCARNGNLYFTRDNGDKKDDIFVCEYRNGAYSAPVALSESVNSKEYEFNAYVDPDENYLLFSSYKRKGDYGGGDLYISLKKKGDWQPAIHLDSLINSGALDYSPFVSFDKKYFFFTSKRTTISVPFKKPASLQQIQNMLSSAGNGSDDIYIVDFKVLEKYFH